VIIKPHCKRIACLFILIASLCPHLAAAAVEGSRGPNLLINGRFDAGPDPGRAKIIPATIGPYGWSVVKGNVEYSTNLWECPQDALSQHPAGSHARACYVIDLDEAKSFGAIRQSFATMAGHRYLVSFELGGNPTKGPAEKKMMVQAAGQSSDHFTVATPIDKHSRNPRWARKQWQFTAVAPITTLTFLSLDTEYGDGGPMLTDISVRDISAKEKAGGQPVIPVAPPVISVTNQPAPPNGQQPSGHTPAPVRLGTPTQIRLNPTLASARANTPVFFEVGLADATSLVRAEDRNHNIKLIVSGPDGRTIDELPLVFEKGDSTPTARVEVQYSEPFELDVRAIEDVNGTDRLKDAQARVFFCDKGTIDNVDLDMDRDQAYAGGSIPFTVVLTDKRGTPVSENTAKNVELTANGVGLLDRQDGWFAPGQCARRDEISAVHAGESTIVASLGSVAKKQRIVKFDVAWTAVLYLSILAGGVLGTLVRWFTKTEEISKWSWWKFSLFFAVGIIAGFFLFLAYDASLLRWLAPGGWEMGWILGGVGGFLGANVFERLADLVVPIKDKTDKGAGPSQ
jgi:Protein of unknown function (DUF642)